jgi:hypothetical protein
VTYRSVRLLSVGRQESTDDYPEDGMEPTSLLDVEGTAHYLNVTKSWVYDNAEKLPTLRVGKQLRWRQSDLDSYLDKACSVGQR